MGGGNQYIQLVCQGFCTVKRILPTTGKELPTFLRRVPGSEPPTSEVGGECVTTAPSWPHQTVQGATMHEDMVQRV